MSKIDMNYIRKNVNMYMVLCMRVSDGQYYPAIGSNGLPLISFDASTLGTVVINRKNAEEWVPNIITKKNWRGKMVDVDNGKFVKTYSDVVIVEYIGNPSNIIK